MVSNVWNTQTENELDNTGQYWPVLSPGVNITGRDPQKMSYDAENYVTSATLFHLVATLQIFSPDNTAYI